MTLTELNDIIASNLTRVGSNRVTAADIRTACEAIISYFASQAIDILPDWEPTLTFNADGSGAGAYCKYPDTTGKKRIFESKTNGNTGTPPPDNQLTTENASWREVSSSAGSAIEEWTAGVYGPGLVIVYHNHSVHGRGLYILTEPSRPYNSVNIETEANSGKWEAISGESTIATLAQVLGNSNDATGLKIINLGNPVAAQDADTLTARQSAINTAISSVKGLVPSSADTLEKLYTLITGVGQFAGEHNAASGLLPAIGSGYEGAINKGDYWKVSVGGTILGVGTVKAGDVIFAKQANASTAANFFAVETNQDLASPSVMGLVKLSQTLVGNGNTDETLSSAAIKLLFDDNITPDWTDTIKGKLARATVPDISTVTAATDSEVDNTKGLTARSWRWAWNAMLSAAQQMTALLNAMGINPSREVVSITAGTLSLDIASRRMKNFDVNTAQSSNFSLIIANSTNLVNFRLTVKITGTVIITMPNTIIMDYAETINERWNSNSKALTLIGTTGSPFLLEFISAGDSIWCFASLKGV